MSEHQDPPEAFNGEKKGQRLHVIEYSLPATGNCGHFIEKSVTAVSRMRSDVACVAPGMVRIGTGISWVSPLSFNLRLVMAKNLHPSIWDEKSTHSVKPHSEQH